MDSQDLSDWFGHLWVWAGISNMSPLLAVKTERTFGVMEVTAQFVWRLWFVSTMTLAFDCRLDRRLSGYLLSCI